VLVKLVCLAAAPLLEILRDSRILCDWSPDVRKITPIEIEQRLTERDLPWLISCYDPDPEEKRGLQRHIHRLF
jgi:hypothetical protein